MNPFTYIILLNESICADRKAGNVVFHIVNCLCSLSITSVWALRGKQCQNLREFVLIEGFGLFSFERQVYQILDLKLKHISMHQR